MSSKTITIDPTAFSFSGGETRKRKPRVANPGKIKFKPTVPKEKNKTIKRTILKFIRDNQEKNSKKIAESAKKSLPTTAMKKSQVTDIDTFKSDFEESVKFLGEMSKEVSEKIRAPKSPMNSTLKRPYKANTAIIDNIFNNVSTELPEVFDLPFDTLDSNNSVKYTHQFTKVQSKPENNIKKGIPPKWGCLKGGNLPTFRHFNRTVNNRPPINNQPIIQSTIPEAYVQNKYIGGGGDNRRNPIKALKMHSAIKTKPPKMRYPKQKRTVKRTFKIGKSEKMSKVGVLISNKTIRKNITTKAQLLKQVSIQDIKKFLIKRGLIKIGTTAPNDVLRKMYESSVMMCGELYNHNTDNLLYNFFNDDSRE
jgi:hypothetical protein